MISFRRVFNPTPEEKEQARQKLIELHRENVRKRACCTCVHYIANQGYYPGFVIGADESCDTERCPIQTCRDYEMDIAKIVDFWSKLALEMDLADKKNAERGE